MKIFYVLILFLIYTLNAQALNIIIEENVLKDYKIFLNGKDPLNIKNFNNKGARRSVVDLIILQQAISIGGYKADFNFIKSPTSLRELQQLKDGKGITTATTSWLYDLKNMQNDIYISEAIINDGEFEAGLYTLDSNNKILNLKTLEEIQNLTAVSNKYWVSDWNTLESLNLKKIYHTIKWKSMTRMIKAKRADILLAPFQSTYDLSFKTEDNRFLPIPNLKVGLKGSRHFAISKKYKNSKEIFEALNKGIKILKTEGIIKKAYEESGFFNQNVKDWQKLN